VHTKLIAAEREGDLWRVTTQDTDSGETHVRKARMLINAAGPWVGDIIATKLRSNSSDGVRLVRGSHIVTRRLYDHDKCYFFQGEDGRIIFAIPYETDFTLIGTTDAEHDDPSRAPVCTPAEQSYLLDFANHYFKQQLTDADVVWTYSGVRPLYDDGAKSATAATRDYTLKLDKTGGAPVLNVFGGKITTYRRLAESVMEKVGVGDLVDRLQQAAPFLTRRDALRLVRAYGTEALEVIGPAKSMADMGHDFGAGLTEREVRWLMAQEFARRADDIVWRRSKLGLRMQAEQIAALDDWMLRQRGGASAAAE